MKEFFDTLGASWISMENRRSTGKIDTVWFRRILTCAEGEKLVVRMSACSRYKLFVNGKMTAFGPCKGGDGYQFYDEWDLSGDLKAGDNEILVEVVSFPNVVDFFKEVSGPDWAVSPLEYAALAVCGKTDKGQNISTGYEGWTSLHCEAMTPIRNTTASWLGYTEHVDLEKSVRIGETDGLNWQNTEKCARIGFNDWGEVSLLPPYERPIPALELSETMTLEKPVGEAAFKDGKLVVMPHEKLTVDLDADELRTAFLNMKGCGGRGAVVKLRYAEAYLHPDENGNLDKNDRTIGEDGVLQGYADEIVPDGGEFDYSPFWIRTFRYLRLEIETADEALTLENPTFRMARYPLKAVTCIQKDESGWIAPIWDISLRTLRNCMHETFEDCPYYEQMQYAMDTRLQMLFAYRMAADLDMAKRTLFDYHVSQLPSGVLQSRYPVHAHQVIPAFSIHWILMLKDYYWQTADRELVREYFGTMDRVLRFFKNHRGERGLVEKLGYWEFIDWVDAWGIGGIPDSDDGLEANHNFIYAYGLGIAAELARVLGFDGIAAEYEAEKADILALLDEKYYDAEAGLYRYNTKGNMLCQHTQVWAVMAGVRDAAFRRSLMEHLDERKDLLPCSFPMQFYLFRAYEEVGMYEKTEKLWDLWKILLEQNLTTVPETPMHSRSDCHAWGSLLLYEYPAKVLGVEPLQPGWAEVGIAPKALYLGKANGRACVPDGYVDVDWRIENGEMTLTAALETDKPVCVTMSDGRTVKVQGRGKTVTEKAAVC